MGTKIKSGQIKWGWNANTVNHPHLVHIPENESLDIDDEIEFKFAEFVYGSQKP